MESSRCLLVCSLLCKKGGKERGAGVPQGFASAERAARCLLYKINLGRPTPTQTPSEGAKPPTRRLFPRPASHLASYFQKFLCFRESLSIFPPSLSSPHLLPLCPCPRRSQKPLCAQLLARSCAEPCGAVQGTPLAEGRSGGLSPVPPNRDPYPPPRHRSCPSC